MRRRWAKFAQVVVGAAITTVFIAGYAVGLVVFVARLFFGS